jgi:hypothetical protein
MAELLQHNFKGRFGKGYHPDTHDKSKDIPARALFGAIMRLPAEYSLEQFIAQIWDQGQTSACVGWAFAQAVMLRAAAAGTPIGLPSPVAWYTGARATERSLAGLTPEQSPLQDNGSSPSIAVSAAQLMGIPSNVAWPFDPATINDEPDLEQLEIASAFKLVGAYRIDSSGSQRIQDVKQAISSGYPVAIGTSVDQAFEDYNGTGLIQAPDPANILGGHMMHLVGYRSDGSFRGVNQWGTSWGDSGLYWAAPGFVTSSLMSDLYVLAGVATGRAGGMVRRVS